MKKFLLPLLVVATLLLPMGLPAAPPFDSDKPAASEKVEAKRISRKEQRRLGIRPMQVLRGLKVLAKEGDIDKEMTAKEIAFVYVADVSSSAEYGGAWSEVAAVDWDNLFAFIEKLVELFLKIWPMFL